MAKKRSVDVVKKWKKQWFTIVAPALFNKASIGQSPANEPANMVGRTLNVSMFTLTGDIKRQNIKIILKISEVKDGKAQTDIVGYQISPAYVKRLSRKSGAKLEDSFVFEAKDAKFRIKPVVVTRSKLQRSIGSKIRKATRDFITEKMKERKSLDVFSDVTSYSLQKTLKRELSKIYPVATCEIKKMVLL